MKRVWGLLLILFYLSTAVFAITQKKILSPEEAFNLSVKKSGDVIAVSLKLGENIYIYDDKFKITIVKPDIASLNKDLNIPKPTTYDKHLVHKVPNLNVLVPIDIIKKYTDGENITLRVEFQGCATSGICYQPMSQDFDFTISNTKQKQIKKQSSPLSEQDSIAKSLATDSIWLVLLTFFGFGLLLSLTPCIFPMIPILSSIIVSQADKITTKRAFLLSLVYVLAMSLAYTIAGVLAGLFGANIQASLQNPWIIVAFSIVFVALAFSMFGFYEIQMPRFIQSKLAKKSDQMHGHGVFGVAIMGFLSALIMGPCVAAPLAGALVYIGQSGDALLGGLALFVMSLGMGMPLLLVGVGAKKYMPKPGAWMNAIKAFFGVMMLALAIWTLSRVIDPSTVMFMWMVLFISTSVYMGALESLKDGADGVRKLIKSIAVIILIYGVFLFIGFSSGATDPLKPLSKFSQSVVITSKIEDKKDSKIFKVVSTLDELKKIIENSKKPVLIDFYADWCVSCVELEKYTFSDKLVQKKMSEFENIKIDVTKNSKEDKKILKEFGIFGPPAILFFKNGKEISSKRIIGFKDAKVFLEHLNGIM